MNTLSGPENCACLTLVVLCVLLGLLAWPAHAQITSSTLNLTDSELNCLNAVSFDLCTKDPSFACPARYFLDQYMEPLYQGQLFTYLVDRFIFETNTSAAWLLSQLLAQGDTYSSFVDATYGTECASDSDTQSLIAGTTLPEAQSGRSWWLILMKQADFCTENQYFLLVNSTGKCVCKEDKNCDETKTHPFTDVMRTMIFVMIVVLVVALSSVYVFTRHGQGLKKEYILVMGTASRVVKILQSAVSDSWRNQHGAVLNNADGSSPPTPKPPPADVSPPQPRATAAAASSSVKTLEPRMRKRTTNGVTTITTPVTPAPLPRPKQTPPSQQPPPLTSVVPVQPAVTNVLYEAAPSSSVLGGGEFGTK